MNQHPLKLFALLFSLVAAILVACATVPGTDRKQLILVPVDQELQLGEQSFRKMKQETPISRDAKTTQLVVNVGQRIAKVAPLKEAKWEFVTFDKPAVPNAFCLPGGKVGIYTGILPITQNEAGLATVMGHEVAHAVARHGAERISQGLLVTMGGIALATAIKDKPKETQALILGAYGVGGALAVVLPHSRSQELEADKLGFFYMAEAGYHPQEAVAFWQRFQAFKGSKGQVPEFLSTHPIDSTRIDQLKKLLPKAMQIYEKSNKA